MSTSVMMSPMPLGRPLTPLGLVVAALVVPGLTACGLFDEGSTVEEAFEYLPADTFAVRFADRGAMAERLGIDDIDPREVSDADLEDYADVLVPKDDDQQYAAAATRLTPYYDTMRDAPLNDFDIEWEATASWGDDEEDLDGRATVWKVGDDLDFDDLADDLEARGYERDGDRFSVDPNDPEDVDFDGLVDAVYPGTFMVNVLLDEEEKLVVAAGLPEALSEIADVVDDDADSLADDGGMDDLVEAAEDDLELVWIESGAEACPTGDRRPPEEHAASYDDLGRPHARAVLVSGDDDVVVALRYDSDDEAEDDLEARESLVDDGVDLVTAKPFDDLGNFSFERDGDLLIIDADYVKGVGQALRSEQQGGGPSACGISRA